MTLDELIGDAPRPGPDDPARDALWCALRREFFQWVDGGRFDPRHLLALETADEQRAWLEARRTAIAQHFATDPRVRVD